MTTNESLLLGLDLGTTNVKALLLDASGNVLAGASTPVELRHRDGGVEQDIEEIWSATLQAIRQLAAEGNLPAVRAIGVSSQGGAIQIVDAEYRPVGPVISWLDGRGAPYDAEFLAAHGSEWLSRHIGHGRSGIGIGQLLRLRRENPAMLRPPNRVGFVGDVIVRRLCGRAAHDASSLSICMVYNPFLRTPDPDVLNELAIDAGQLPDLLATTQAAGVLLPEMAEATGLTAGIPVSPAIHDQYASALGCGAIHAGDVMLGTGTAWVFLAITDQLLPPVLEEALVCSHVVDGLYAQLLSMVNGGSCFAWALDLLGLRKLKGAQIDEMLSQVSAGSEGLRFCPLLTAGGGAGLPAGTTGGLRGLRLSHKAPHVLRSVTEGLALELARYLQLLTQRGVRPQRLVMGGGAAASKVTPQIVADATGLEVACTTHSDISALGAGIIARGLIEPQSSLDVLSAQMAPATRIVKPGPDRDLYRRLAEEYDSSLPRK